MPLLVEMRAGLSKKLLCVCVCVGGGGEWEWVSLFLDGTSLLSHHSEVVEDLYLFRGAVGQKATELENAPQLVGVVLRIDDEYGGLDVGVGIL